MPDRFTAEAGALLDRVDQMHQRSMSFASPTAAPLTPRPYQSEAIESIRHAYDEGIRRSMIVLATGLGKTVVFSNLAAQLQTDTLVIAHRDELLDQAADKLRTVWPDVEIGKVKGKSDDRHAQVVVGSVQTLSRPKRLAAVNPRRFGLCVVDEAHHAAAQSYRAILDALHPDCLVLGVTATPDRGDGVGLHDVFESIVYERDMLFGIREGYLADLRGVLVELDVDFGAIRKSRGDYVDGDMGRALHDANAPAHVLKAWREHAADRKTVIFTPTVDLSREMVETFEAAGVRAGHIDGMTPEFERKRTLGMFAAGELQMLSNCAVLTEGFDEPSIGCVVIARPTTSRGLYTQMVGRGTRKHPGKDDCLVIDAVGVSRRQSLVTVASLIGRKMKTKGAGDDDVLVDLGDLTLSQAAALAEQSEEEPVEIVDGRIKAHEVDLFANVAESRLAWAGAGGGRFVIDVGVGYVALVPSADDKYHVVKRAAGRDKDGNRWPFHVISADVDLEMAQGIGEDYVRRHAGEGMALASRGASWRSRAPQPSQIEAAQKWRIVVPEDATAGQVSDMIAAKAAAADLRKFRP